MNKYLWLLYSTCICLLVWNALIQVPSAYASGTISGTIFMDLNSNGIDGGTEPGMPGVTIEVYNADEQLLGSTISGANGTYSITVSESGPYRIMYSGWPAGFYPTGIGSNSQSNVRFLSGPSSSADFGIMHPDDYSPNDAQVALPIMQVGSNNNSSDPSLISLMYSAVSGSAGYSIEVTPSQVGSIWGTAYQRQQKLLFTSAMLKRHSDLGPQGTGGVYVLNYNDNLNAFLEYSFSLQGVQPSNGGAPIDLGSVTRNYTSGLVLATSSYDYTLSDDASQITRDLDAFAKVGKVAYGSIAVDHANNSLWLVNLAQRALIRVSLDDYAPSAWPNTVEQYLISDLPQVPSCSAGELRPWALTFHRSLGYLGMVCDASISQDAADLRAYVMSFDPTDPTAGLNPVIDFPLDYAREAAEDNSMSPGLDANRQDARWRPWADTWAQTGLPILGGRLSYPQPILSDIVFTPANQMILAFANRFADQSANGHYVPISGSVALYSTINAGDTLLACNVSNVYVLEGSSGCAVNEPSSALGFNTDGPSGQGEFFHADSFHTGLIYHLETTTGGLALIPNLQQVLVTGFDTTAQFTQGLYIFSTVNGTLINSANVYGLNYPYLDTASFGLANAQGKPSLIIPETPIEIGNRVWVDANGDGIQNADEPGISGVVVDLYDDTNTKILSTTTNAQGVYWFVNSSLIRPNSNYSVRINPNQSALNGFIPTINNTSIDDRINSDGVTGVYGSMISADVQTAGMASTSHNYDFGFVPAYTIGDLVWDDVNNNGLFDSGETGMPGIVLGLYADADTNGLPDGTAIYTTTTDSQGEYVFPPVVAGKYLVGFTPPPAYISSTGSSTASGPYEPAPSTLQNDADNGTLSNGQIWSNTLDVQSNISSLDFGLFLSLSIGDLVWHDANNNGVRDNGENGIGGVTLELYADTNIDGLPDATAILSTTTDAQGSYSFDQLAPGNYLVALIPPAGYTSSTGLNGRVTGPYEPAPTISSNDSDAGTLRNGRIWSNTIGLGVANDSVDFGLFKPLQIGNVVWNDTNNNGLRDSYEAPIAGVTLDLYADNNGDGIADGSAILSTRSSAQGSYQFDMLVAGKYVVGLTPLSNFVSSSGANGKTSGPYEPAPANSPDNADSGTLRNGRVWSSSINLTASNNTIDFALFQPAVIGDTVWHDQNGDGMQDAGEPLVPNVTVTLYSANDTVVASTTTNAYGYYTFSQVIAGRYRVGFSKLPSSLPLFTASKRFSAEYDSDANQLTGKSDWFYVAAGERQMTIDAGLIAKPPEAASIGLQTPEKSPAPGGAVVISWSSTPSSPIETVQIWRGTGSDIGSAELAATIPSNGSAQQWSDPNGTGAHNYWFVVQLEDGSIIVYGPIASAKPAYRILLPLVRR